MVWRSGGLRDETWNADMKRTSITYRSKIHIHGKKTKL